MDLFRAARERKNAPPAIHVSFIDKGSYGEVYGNDEFVLKIFARSAYMADIKKEFNLMNVIRAHGVYEDLSGFTETFEGKRLAGLPVTLGRKPVIHMERVPLVDRETWAKLSSSGTIKPVKFLFGMDMDMLENESFLPVNAKTAAECFSAERVAFEMGLFPREFALQLAPVWQRYRVHSWGP